jgi:hypothetical protein
MATTTHTADASTSGTAGPLDRKPLAGSFITGLIASLCCGGSLIFASIGLGAFYSALGLSRFVPQALAAGAITIAAINYFSYRLAAKQTNGSSNAPRRKMIISTGIGLVMMAGTFILLEWLNHGVFHGDRFLARPEFSQALITGVPNIELIYVAATFFALALLWALPFPNHLSASPQNEGRVKRAARVAIFGAATILVIGAVVDASSKFGAPAGSHGAPAGSHTAPAASQRGQAH